MSKQNVIPMHKNPLMEAALSYAAIGWHIFPCWWAVGNKCSCGSDDCQNQGKHPIYKLTPNGQKDSTTDQETIKAWWDAYAGESTVVLDEFDGWLPYTQVKRLFDYGETKCETKGSKVQCLAHRFIMTTNVPPWCWYRHVKDPSKALERRFIEFAQCLLIDQNKEWTWMDNYMPWESRWSWPDKVVKWVCDYQLNFDYPINEPNPTKVTV